MIEFGRVRGVFNLSVGPCLANLETSFLRFSEQEPIDPIWPDVFGGQVRSIAEDAGSHAGDNPTIPATGQLERDDA